MKLTHTVLPILTFVSDSFSARRLSAFTLFVDKTVIFVFFFLPVFYILEGGVVLGGDGPAIFETS